MCPSSIQVIIANTQGNSIQPAAAAPAAAVYG